MRLDIGWSDLAAAFLRCIFPGSAERHRRAVAEHFAGAARCVTCLSARTGFDLLLQALALPPGSEVLIGAVTLQPMTRILEHHGLVVVPLDLDLDSLQPSVADLERAVSPRARILVLTPLFGAIGDIDSLIAAARLHGLFVLEDSAQTYDGEYVGHPAADVSMTSFGPTKTASALGGGVLIVRDEALLEEMRRREAAYPVQPSAVFRRRLRKAAMLKVLAWRPVYAIVARVCRKRGIDSDFFMAREARAFHKVDLIPGIRLRPSAPMLALLHRRLRRIKPEAYARRGVRGAWLRAQLGDCVGIPGKHATRHSYWMFPVTVTAREQLFAALQSAGFQTTTRPALHVASPSGCEEATALHTPRAHALNASMLLLPWSSAMPRRALRRLAETVRVFAERQADDRAR